MSFKINAHELRKALAEIEQAETNGFMHCVAIFDPHHVEGPFVHLEYSDMHEKGHPTAGHMDWGRFQGVTRRNRLDKNGQLVPLAASSHGDGK
jgi:hypothetical protein